MERESQVIRARLHLLNELRSGTRLPGAPISVKDTAMALKLSHTPVREALARLAGEGVVVTAGERNGFAVPRLGARGVIEYHAMLAMLLDGILRDPVDRAAPPRYDGVNGNPVAMMESLIAWIIADFGNAPVIHAVWRIGTVLAPYRRMEPAVIADWSSGLRQFQTEVVAGQGSAASRRFWQVRADHAAALVDAVEYRRYTSDIRGI
jgi:DNA-binding Lrp family transcriptional regulator